MDKKFTIDYENIHSKKYIKKSYNKGSLADANTGEFLDNNAVVFGTKIIDGSKFIKLYTDLLDIWLKDLSKNGLMLVIYILRRLEKDTDIVLIDLKEFSKEYGYKTRKTGCVSVKELIDKNIIRLRNGNEYYINVNYFFNGDRTRVI